MSVPHGHLKLFILAGEPSGDRIAADLIRRLKARVPLALIGVGGQELIDEGLKSLYPMSDLAVMGLSDVIKRLPLLVWRMRQTAKAIYRANPDIVVLVDSQDFSKLVARRLKKLGYKGKIILYVAPTVWARAPERAKKLVPLFDEVLAVLPFEPEVMARLDGPLTSYVGHPSLGERLSRLVVEKGPLVLLPGSRDGELRRHLPLFRQLVERLAGHPAITGVTIPTLPALKARLERETADWSVPVAIVADRSARAALYGEAVLAVVVSGTATLELGMAQVPMVVNYVLDTPQARAYEKIGRPAISLPNIILGQTIVPELVQPSPDLDALTQAVATLLGDPSARAAQIAAFATMAELMDNGTEQSPRQNPADRVMAHWLPSSTDA